MHKPFTRGALLLTAAMALTRSAQAASEPPYVRADVPTYVSPVNLITFNPLALIVGTVEVEWERAVTPHISVFAGPQLFWLKAAGLAEARGIGAIVGARLFVTSSAPAGFYISPYLKAGYARVSALGRGGEGAKLGGGGLFGYTWLVGDAVAISVGAGVQYENVQADRLDFSFVRPTLRLAVGPAF